MTEWPGYSVIMPDVELTTTDSPPTETSSSVVWAVSFAFWITLLIAAGIYGTVALAPRLYAWIQVRHEFITNAHQLQALESEVDYLERVRHALETDPDFVRRMAESSIARDVTDAEVIPVSGALVFGSSDQLQERLPEPEQPAATGLIHRFAADRQLRTGLLASSGLLIVFAFTVLNGTGGVFVALLTQAATTAIRFPLQRYRRTASKDIVTDAPDSDVPE